MALKNLSKVFSNPRSSKDVSSSLSSTQKDDRRRICKLIKVLITTGLDTLELKHFDELKCLCLKSDELIQFAYKILFDNLHKNHSQIRLSSLQICDNFFRCSKVFRLRVIEDLPEIFPLILKDSSSDKVFGGDAELPPPKSKADLLSRSAMLVIKQWYDLFGDKPKYFRLKLGHRYVCCLYERETGASLDDVDTSTLPASCSLQLASPSSSGQVNDLAIEEINVFTTQLDDCLSEMTTALSSLDTCLQLLLPTPDEFNLDETETDEQRTENTKKTDSEKSQRSQETDLINHSSKSAIRHQSRSRSKERSSSKSSSTGESSLKSSGSRESYSKPSGSSKKVSSKLSSSSRDRSVESSSSKDCFSKPSGTSQELSSKSSSSKEISSKLSSSFTDRSLKSSCSKESSSKSFIKHHHSESQSREKSPTSSSSIKVFSKSLGSSKTIPTSCSSPKECASKSSSSEVLSSKSSSTSKRSSSKSSSSKERSSKYSHSKSTQESSSKESSSKSTSSKESSSKSSSSKDSSSKESSSKSSSSKDSSSKESSSKSSSSKVSSSKSSSSKESSSKSSSCKESSSKSSSSKDHLLKSRSPTENSSTCGHSKHHSKAKSKERCSKSSHSYSSSSEPNTSTDTRSKSTESKCPSKQFNEQVKEYENRNTIQHTGNIIRSEDRATNESNKVVSNKTSIIAKMGKSETNNTVNKVDETDRTVNENANTTLREIYNDSEQQSDQTKIDRQMNDSSEENAAKVLHQRKTTDDLNKAINCNSKVESKISFIGPCSEKNETKEDNRIDITDENLEDIKANSPGTNVLDVKKSEVDILKTKSSNKELETENKTLEPGIEHKETDPSEVVENIETIKKHRRISKCELMDVDTDSALSESTREMINTPTCLDTNELNAKTVETCRKDEIIKNDLPKLEANSIFTKNNAKFIDERTNDTSKNHETVPNELTELEAKGSLTKNSEEFNNKTIAFSKKHKTDVQNELMEIGTECSNEEINECEETEAQNDSEDGDDDDDEQEEVTEFNRDAPGEYLREMGILFNTNITITLPNDKIEISETADNCDILENARGSYNLTKKKYLPLLLTWYEKLHRSKHKCSEQMKDALGRYSSMRARALQLVEKYEKIRVLPKASDMSSDRLASSTVTGKSRDEVMDEHGEDSDDFEDMEEVEFEEADLLPILVDTSEERQEQKMEGRVEAKQGRRKRKRETEEEWSLRVSEMERVDPSSGHHHKSLIASQRPGTASQSQTAGVATDVCSPGGSKSTEEIPHSVYGAFSDRKRKLLALAPRLPYDTDLYHWEDETLPVPRLLPNSTEGHRFWSASALDEEGEGIPVPGGSSLYRTRVIEFSGAEASATDDRPCHAPLPSGKLCPRRDKLKCPFHGIIFARDAQGTCLDPEDEVKWQRTLEERRRNQVPDWQNPALLRELKAATGVDLTMPKKGQRRRVAPGPGLMKILKSESTPAGRIKKKIFQKSSMRRVASALNKIDERKFRDKFGDQFNYS